MTATPLAVVEAKKLSLGPRNALTQALRYARGLDPSLFDFDGVRVPFGYSTNGEQIYFQDLRRPDSYSRPVSRFHTPAALSEYLGYQLRRPCRCWARDRGPGQASLWAEARDRG